MHSTFLFLYISSRRNVFYSILQNRKSLLLAQLIIRWTISGWSFHLPVLNDHECAVEEIQILTEANFYSADVGVRDLKVAWHSRHMHQKCLPMSMGEWVTGFKFKKRDDKQGGSLLPCDNWRIVNRIEWVWYL